MNSNTTKTKIMETMYRLIAEKGYDKTSIGQIADAIGIKKASIYYYFKSKEDIFLQMVRELYKEDYSEQADFSKKEIGTDEYRSGLLATGEQFIDSYFTNHSLRKVYAEIDIQTTRIPALKEFINADDVKFNCFLKKCMMRGVEIGAFPENFDAGLNAQILYTTLIGIDQAILYELPIEPKAVWKEVISKLFEREGFSQS
ncbi:MAG: TetR/AcrR family transcriptional regulator [Oscillospiraceae bacterium]